MYHVNNPNEIINGSRPSVTEIGPFVYKEYREKIEINSTDDCTIRFGQYKRYDFDMEKTKELCPDCASAKDTKITIINAAYVGMIQLIREGFCK